MKKKKVKRAAMPIVVGHLEKISSGIFERYHGQIMGLIEKGQGVYALYRRDKLYYVGLASNLRNLKEIMLHISNTLILGDLPIGRPKKHFFGRFFCWLNPC